MEITTPPGGTGSGHIHRSPVASSRRSATALALGEGLESVCSVSSSPLGESRYSRDFQVIQCIGTGNFSEVYRCRNYTDLCDYAIKRVKVSKNGLKPSSRLKEVYALSALSTHRHLVRYYGAWIENEDLYIQTELCEGGSLQDKLNAKLTLSEPELCTVLRQVAKGLQHMHRHGLVHLDIKPANIYIFKDEDQYIYKIGDLGHASSYQDQSKDISEGDGHYASSDLFGTLNPIHLPKADVFSLACSIYHLALGDDLPDNGNNWLRIREGTVRFLTL